MPVAYRYIDSNETLSLFLDDLSRRKVARIAVDFECEFQLHVYGEFICLIQVFDGENYTLIDPLELDNGLLADFFTREIPEKIFFDASSDYRLIQKQFGLNMGGVRDIQKLVIALEMDGRGLDKVTSALLGLEIKNKSRFQKMNWTLRPIPEDARQYALSDVQHLFKLEALLLDMAREEALNIEEVYAPIVLEPKESVPGIMKDRRYDRLNREQKNRFKSLMKIRDEAARSINRPPNAVIAKNDMFELARNPETVQMLQFHGKISPSLKNQLISEIRSL